MTTLCFSGDLRERITLDVLVSFKWRGSWVFQTKMRMRSQTTGRFMPFSSPAETHDRG